MSTILTSPTEVGNILEFPITIDANGTDTRQWNYNGSKGSIQVSGTFDGGTLTVESSSDGGVNFVDDGTLSMTAPGKKYFSRVVPKGEVYQFVFTGGGGSEDIEITVNQGEGH